MLRSAISVSSLAVAFLGISGVLGSRSSVICSRISPWMKSNDNEDPCAYWARMRSFCDTSSASDIKPLSFSVVGSYSPPTNQTTSCDCNLDAYNLMSSCTYCQGAHYDNKWPSVSTWASSCPNTSNGLPRGLNHGNNISEAELGFDVEMAFSVSLYTPSSTWDPKAACRSGGDSHACDSSTSSGHSWSSSWDDDSLTATYRVYGYIIVGLWGAVALGSLLALIVCCIRQRNRKRFYKPLAAYYLGGGLPPYTAYNPAYNPNSVTKGHYPSQSQDFSQPLIAKA
ncbi:hypothetical protein BKA62DRAFT_687230 [Auriculariales sp. MPI-PUGE-AT-0066]|nr:hypothetical protein BKA62DRAFT_687230 [Auriculariales sp. MPI-PUGE-AT-0066]